MLEITYLVSICLSAGMDQVDVKVRDRDEKDTVNPRDRDETETLHFLNSLSFCQPISCGWLNLSSNALFCT